MKLPPIKFSTCDNSMYMSECANELLVEAKNNIDLGYRIDFDQLLEFLAGGCTALNYNMLIQKLNSELNEQYKNGCEVNAFPYGQTSLH